MASYAQRLLPMFLSRLAQYLTNNTAYGSLHTANLIETNIKCKQLYTTCASDLLTSKHSKLFVYDNKCGQPYSPYSYLS